MLSMMSLNSQQICPQRSNLKHVVVANWSTHFVFFQANFDFTDVSACISITLGAGASLPLQQSCLLNQTEN